MGSAVYRQMFSEKTALMLQQIWIPSRSCRVLFAGVCMSVEKEEAGIFCEKGVDFFRENFFERDFRQRMDLFLQTYGREKGLSYAILFCENMEGIFWGRGNTEVLLVSHFLAGSRLRKLKEEVLRQEVGLSCQMEEGVGILLMTGKVFGGEDERKLKEFFRFGAECGEDKELEKLLKDLLEAEGDKKEEGREKAAVVVRM